MKQFFLLLCISILLFNFDQLTDADKGVLIGHVVGKNGVDLFAGKGKPIDKKLAGEPGYKERVDFGEHIGYYVHEEDPNIKLPTTKGIIHYSKRGAHIVPSHPDGK
jgi:hypothetical protein